MAKLVYGMNVSLDGYVDHLKFMPSPALFRHFIEQARDQTGSVYGRRMYEVMRYWDEDSPEWGAEEHDFAAAWRRQPKWVVSRSLKSVGPHATLVGDDLEAAIRGLKARHEGNQYADRATPGQCTAAKPMTGMPEAPGLRESSRRRASFGRLAFRHALSNVNSMRSCCARLPPMLSFRPATGASASIAPAKSPHSKAAKPRASAGR
jgi:hypothetical protein